MAALSWNEIKDRATRFSKEWAGTTREEADAKPFLIEFFDVFGIPRRKVATFEEKVKKLEGGDGYIDLLWKGVLLVEMKSFGKSLDKAFAQAKEYTQKLKTHELPKYILVSDFHTLRLHDLEDGSVVEFTLDALVQHVQHFGFIAGYQKRVYKEQDPVNLTAAERMGRLHDRLEDIGYTGHPLEVYLVRILFCLFAEDTTIFQRQQFQDYIEGRTAEDGSDLAPRLAELFQVLNTPEDRRYKNLDEQLAAFPYVNGKLFEEMLPTASFDRAMRTALLECCYLDWSKISPAIFGSMFQSVMNPKERRNLGAHYTSEKNILKLIRPLFLDDLYAEFEVVKSNRGRLAEFHKKLSALKFLDPAACGCGNFLVITYRELRMLEAAVLREMNRSGQGFLDVRDIMGLDVDAMYGIEYEEFPAQIAQVALWLMDHQMNMAISQEFGQYFVRLPLKKSPTIAHGDALKIDWARLLPSGEGVDKASEIFVRQKFPASPEEPTAQPSKFFDFILGNPPFIGSKLMQQEQRNAIVNLLGGSDGSGILDYVSGWYIKAAQYIQGTNTKVGFVSTNSIVQGEQVAPLWAPMLNTYGIHIHFAHRTFKWSNEARGNAAVYCVIVGFASFDAAQKTIYEYEDIRGEAHAIASKNINPYLLDARDILIPKRMKPICNIPEIGIGNKPIDGGNYLFSGEERDAFIKSEPNAAKWFRRWLGADEFINGWERWCLWLGDCPPNELRQMPEAMKRVEAVRKLRLESVSPPTRALAKSPTRFHVEFIPTRPFLVIPEVSSERRRYIPFGFLHPNTLASNKLRLLPDATMWHFGILTSEMHMAWVRQICGRLKSDFTYSIHIVYNNFPWPKTPSPKSIAAVEAAAQGILDARALFPGSSLADLYDPVAMPPALAKAHEALDRAVDKAYGGTFASEAKRMEFLFGLYEEYVAGLFAAEKKQKRTKK